MVSILSALCSEICCEAKSLLQRCEETRASIDSFQLSLYNPEDVTDLQLGVAGSFKMALIRHRAKVDGVLSAINQRRLCYRQSYDGSGPPDGDGTPQPTLSFTGHPSRNTTTPSLENPRCSTSAEETPGRKAKQPVSPTECIDSKGDLAEISIILETDQSNRETSVRAAIVKENSISSNISNTSELNIDNSSPTNSTERGTESGITKESFVERVETEPQVDSAALAPPSDSIVDSEFLSHLEAEQDRQRKLTEKKDLASTPKRRGCTNTPKAKTSHRRLKRRKSQRNSTCDSDVSSGEIAQRNVQAETEQLSKRERFSALAAADVVASFSADDDGFETYRKRGQQYNLIQLETIARIKTYLMPQILPDGKGYLIRIIGQLTFNETLIEWALARAWETFKVRSKIAVARESSYREIQANGKAAFVFDAKLSAASEAYRMMASLLMCFLKGCVKAPSAFYTFISIVKTRKAAYPLQILESLPEPYKYIHTLCWQRLSSSCPLDENVFSSITDYQLKQIFAEALHKERQTRTLFGGYFDELPNVQHSADGQGSSQGKKKGKAA